MKSQPIKNAICILILIAATVFSSLAAAAPIRVELEVVTTGGVDVLQIKDNPKPCDGVTATSSCIEVAEGKTPYMIFKLKDACEGGSGDPEYALSGFRITQVEKVWPTPANPLNAVVASDFKADPSTGEVNFNSGNNSKTKKKLKFKNRNSNAYSVYYEITAQHCDSSSDADDLHLDPEIRNRGGAN